MTPINKLLTGLTVIGLATATLLPDRQTNKVAGTILGGIRGLFATVISGKG